MDLSKEQKKQLLNECIGSINNTLSICGGKRDTCYNRLRNVFDREPFRNAGYLLIELGNPDTFRLRKDKKENSIDFWTDLKVATQITATCVIASVLTNTCIAKYGSHSNTNSYMDPTVAAKTTTNNTTAMVENNFKAKWVVNLPSTPSLRHKKPCWPEVPISL